MNNFKCNVSVVFFLLFVPVFVLNAHPKWQLGADVIDSTYFTIIVDYKQVQQGDTLSLYLVNPIYPYPVGENDGIIHAVQTNGYFKFKVPTKSAYGYFTIMKPRTFTDKGQSDKMMSLIENSFWESGDSIFVELSHKETFGGLYGDWKFQGRGSEKYTIRDSIFSINVVDDQKQRYEFDENFDGSINRSVKLKRLQVLEEQKKKISEVAYESMKADILYSFSSGFRFLQRYFNDSIRTASIPIQNEFIRKYKEFSDESLRVRGEEISPENLANNPTYLRYLKLKYNLDCEIFNGGYDQNWIYERIKSTTTGLLREREVVLSFLQSRRAKNVAEIIEDAKSYFRDPYCIRFLNNVDIMGVGSKITNATFFDSNGLPVRIFDFKGKVILLDFWFNGCGSCMSVYRELTSKLHDHFRDETDFVILSINTDRSKQRWLDGIKSGLYTDHNAVNINTNGMGFKHPFILDYQIPFCPWLILIDREGTIRSVDGEELFKWETLRKTIEATLNIQSGMAAK